ncbi:MAG: hypothetical protein ACW98Y_13875 [Candidatus Thorarchaeota archaeon]|jgi:DNA-directed RNA polymerase subunit RPC12/RpoP
MFSCKKCTSPLYLESAILKDKILKMDVQCILGHKSVRRIAEHQIEEMAGDIFDRMYTCLDCGYAMQLLETEIHEGSAEGSFLCPNHGIQKREFPAQYLGHVNLAGAECDPYQAVRDSFTCSQCGQVYAVSDMEENRGVLEMSVRCANGHKNTKYLSASADSNFVKTILQRVVHCDRCGLPGHVSKIEERKKSSYVHTTCPTHGGSKKIVPSSILPLLQESVNEIPEDAIVMAALRSTDCHRPLAIRGIEETSSGYKFRTICPGKGDGRSVTIPVRWNQRNSELIAMSMLNCNECGLQTNILDAKKKKKQIEFRIVCPIHGVMQRDAPREVFETIRDASKNIDKIPSIIRSMNCPKDGLPLSLRDVENRRGLTEFDMECRNGHHYKRFFVPNMETEALVDVYKNLFKCPECYDPMDLVYTEPAGRETRVVQLCALHGKRVLDVPHDHAKAIQDGYEEIKADRLKPRIEVAPEEPVEEYTPISEPVITPSQDVEVYRGCEIIGGKFDFKVKVSNPTDFVITNVTVSLVAYPQDCIELGGESVKTISRIEVGGFRSPTFTLYPTKDCVQGKIVATVSFIDFRDQLHTLQVEPYLIRSVCDLLQPIKATAKEFNLLLGSLTKTDQEQTLDWNARVLFTKAEKLLPAKNFHIIDTDERIVGDQFIGTIRGYAVGKFTKKKVAVIFLIAGAENGRHSSVKVEALGDDIAMLPTTIDELAETMDSWICLRCGAPLETEQVEELGKRTPIRCKYCSHTLTMGLYLM